MEAENFMSVSPNFSGSVSQHYEKYLGPMFFEPYAIEISKRVESFSVPYAVELACGTGRVTRHLREVIPVSSKLVASDISGDMLAVAKEKLKGLNIDWQMIDAQQLPFDDKSIDLVVCCFGFMFVPDKPKAFAEAYRVLRPGGMLLFSTWDKLEYNGASHVYRKIVKGYLEADLPESFNIPFSMNDQDAMKEILQGAGFSKIAMEQVEKKSVCQTAKEAAYGLARGGSLYNEIMKRNPAWIGEIVGKVEKELSEKFGAVPMIAPMRAIISQAWK